MITDLDEAILFLERFLDERITGMGLKSARDGFILALKLLRSMRRVDSISSPADRLLLAFDEYAAGQKSAIVATYIQRCTVCGEEHTELSLLKMATTENEKTRYWGICPTRMDVCFHFPEDEVGPSLFDDVPEP